MENTKSKISKMMNGLIEKIILSFAFRLLKNIGALILKRCHKQDQKSIEFDRDSTLVLLECLDGAIEQLTKFRNELVQKGKFKRK